MALPIPCGCTKCRHQDRGHPHDAPDGGAARWRQSTRPWRPAQIHQAKLTALDFSADSYILTQLRDDLRKDEGPRPAGARWETVLVPARRQRRARGRDVLFHQRVCGPLANSLFHHRPKKVSRPAKIEAACHKADDAIQNLIDLLAARGISERQILNLAGLETKLREGWRWQFPTA